jgi:hypothetical protein
VEARQGAGEHGLRMLAQLAAAVAVWLALAFVGAVVLRLL